LTTRALFAALMLLCPAASEARPPVARLAAGDHYVAMGSSFAAGPGITTAADTPPTRCGRSSDNYAHQLARRLNLVLTDVSCGGATTAHVLGNWNELPPQLDALKRDTRLVTVTIGGNDVGYIGSLMAASCAGDASSAVCKGLAARRPAGQSVPTVPDEAAWQLLETRLNAVAAEVRQRAPDARLIFVDYLSVIPRRALCGLTPIEPERAKLSLGTARHLAAITARAARSAGAGLIRASSLSTGHDACAATPWTTGLVVDRAPYHPNLAGMTAVADALEREVRTK
jgi:lysophospholipase L1-like esterase